MSLRVCAAGSSDSFGDEVAEDTLDGEGDESGAGGGRTGAGPRLSRSVRLRVAISWRRARFSDWVEPSSERMAERRRSRSAMLSSRVEIYSAYDC
jgi:hypothetical protein